MANETSDAEIVESPGSDWMDPIRSRLGDLGDRSLGLSIYKVPNKLRKVDEEAYTPCIVSIGPFHSSTTTRSVLHRTSENKDVKEHQPQTPDNKENQQQIPHHKGHQPQTPDNKENQQQTPDHKGHLLTKDDEKWWYMLPLLQQLVNKHDHLLAMEENKWCYMLDLLHRTAAPEETLNTCGKAILDIDKYVRGSYAEDIKFKTHQLAEIMLVDGCFTLELFLRSSLKDFKEEDPIFHNAWMVPSLRHDLTLLENQIPFFILEELFQIIVEPLRQKDSRLPSSVTDLALSFFFPDLSRNQDAFTKLRNPHPRHLHLLDLLHSFYLEKYPRTDSEGEKLFNGSGALCLTLTFNTAPGHHLMGKCEVPAQSRRFKKCATELSDAGIEFDEGKEAHFLDIRFSKAKGVITIPPLCIDETTKSLLRNLIAFEQCLGSTKQHFTSYVILIESLIHSLADVKLLEKRKIIINNLGKVEDVLTLFSNISREIVPKDFCFGTLCDEVNEYQNSYCHWYRLWKLFKVWCQKSWAVLMRDYFSSPWSFISFIAACALLILTVFQTNYAARADRRSQ